MIIAILMILTVLSLVMNFYAISSLKKQKDYLAILGKTLAKVTAELKIGLMLFRRALSGPYRDKIPAKLVD